MVNAQERLNKNYPKEVKEIDLANQKLVGWLFIQDFPNLESIKCGNNKNLTSIKLINLPKLNYFHANGCQITSLTVSNCPNIAEFNAANNLLTDTSFLNNFNPEKLNHLSIHSNNFDKQNLSFLSEFTHLEKLFVDNHNKEKLEKNIYNRFTGSLQPLQNLTNLKYINIANTDIDSGLEYLPESCKKVCLNNSWDWKGAGYLNLKWEMERSVRFTEVTEKLQQLEVNEPPFVKDWYRLAPWWQARNLLGEEEFKKQVIQKEAQKWLDEKYPSHTNRQYIREVTVSNKNAIGELDLSDFANLEKLDCSNNKLTNLKLSKYANLFELDCSGNTFGNTDFLKKIPNKERLEKLNLSNNKELKGDLEFLASFVGLKELDISSCSFEGSLEHLKNIKELKVIDISHTDIDSDIECLANSCWKLHCDSETKSKSLKIAKILTKYLKERSNGEKYYNLAKWRENDVASAIPLERLYVIQGNIKQFLKKWGMAKDKNNLSEISKLKSPEELYKHRWAIYVTQSIGRGSAVIGVVLTFQGLQNEGTGVLAIYPIAELIISKLEESLKNKENKWKEFLADADVFLDNYNELLGILVPLKISESRKGLINEKIKELNKKIDDFLKIYDSDKNKEIDIEELKEKRYKLTQDLNKEKNSEVQGIINSIEELKIVITDYRKYYYYGKNEEKDDKETNSQLEITSEEKNEQIEKEQLVQKKNELEIELKRAEVNYYCIKKELSERKMQESEELTRTKQEIDKIKKQLTRTNFLLLENRVKNLMNMSWNDKVSQGWKITWNGISKTKDYLITPYWYWKQWRNRNNDLEVENNQEIQELSQISIPNSDNQEEDPQEQSSHQAQIETQSKK